MTTPDALITTYERWQKAGRPTQIPSPWKLKSWTNQLGHYKEFFNRLNGDPIDRKQAVQLSPIVTNEEEAVQVFLLAMLWGHGLVGYGPFRTSRILDRPEAAAELLEVAQVAQRDGGLAAFKLVVDRRNGESRSFLKWLGPAFGTKYIYFLTAKNNPQEPAPVMDAVVYRWFRKHAPDRKLRVDFWHTPSYEQFLNSLEEWASDIAQRFGQEIRIDDVEYLIFAEGSRFEGNDWSELWEAEQRAASASLLFDQLRALASSHQNHQFSFELIDKLEAHLLKSDASEQPPQC
ncbi:hypothetical protein [Brevibacterium sp. JSBI002]|uniref:8-oxoguanine DNA glycosylase OGG fold protein n=1 Tax=Brevibacterium sp. JSBI002 TaxID=2886045 RepID=UPI00222F91AB|nr:hypothetical protein [Brevibacterium sp. JSBI002]UZD61108.1 hypothetical protein LJ362_10420 [Brevibacterium sp. JSBI002]